MNTLNPPIGRRNNYYFWSHTCTGPGARGTKYKLFAPALEVQRTNMVKTKFVSKIVIVEKLKRTLFLLKVFICKNYSFNNKNVLNVKI